MDNLTTPTAPIGHNLPKRRAIKTFARICPECAVSFQGHKDSRFCSDRCKNTFHNRSAKRGKVAIPLLLAWLGGSRAKGDTARAYARRQVEELSQLWLAEDKAAGRMPAPEFVRHKQAMGWRAVDLAAGG